MGSFRAFVYRTLSRIGVLATDGYPQAPHGHDFTANLLHLDGDVVCPRCLGWIEPDDIVRRTAYGPAQHEHCPVRVAVPCP